MDEILVVAVVSQTADSYVSYINFETTYINHTILTSILNAHFILRRYFPVPIIFKFDLQPLKQVLLDPTMSLSM